MTAPPGSWQQRFAKPDPADDTVYTLVLVQGEDMQHASQWAYALIPADNYPAFREAEMAGEYRLADFGKVLRFGPGTEPPAAIRDEMEQAYGANPHFEQELHHAWEDAIGQLVDLQHPSDTDEKNGRETEISLPE